MITIMCHHRLNHFQTHIYTNTSGPTVEPFFSFIYYSESHISAWYAYHGFIEWTVTVVLSLKSILNAVLACSQNTQVDIFNINERLYNMWICFPNCKLVINKFEFFVWDQGLIPLSEKLLSLPDCRNSM